MKRVKRVLLRVAAVLCIMIMLCGCASKLKKTDKATVRAKIDALNAYDDKFMTEDNDFIGGVMKNNWKIKFRDYGSKSSCEIDFKMELLSIEPDVKTEEANYVITEKETDKEYKICTRIDGTYLYLCGPISQKEDLQKFAKDLGYLK